MRRGRAKVVPVEAGQQVIHEGHRRARRLFALAEGEFDVHEKGMWLRREVPGDYFDAIALLRDIPRTASVTGVGDDLLFALRRHEFLAAVTGHA